MQTYKITFNEENDYKENKYCCISTTFILFLNLMGLESCRFMLKVEVETNLVESRLIFVVQFIWEISATSYLRT